MDNYDYRIFLSPHIQAGRLSAAGISRCCDMTGYFISQIPQKWFQGLVLAAAYAAILLHGFNDFFVKEHLKSRLGDHVKDFAAVIKDHVSDTKKLVFYDAGYHPLQSYLGRNQAAIKPDPADFDQADWMVAPVDENFRPETTHYHYERWRKLPNQI